MNTWLKDLDAWQSHQSAPKDGTHIIVSQEGTALGVFHWEERTEFLFEPLLNRATQPTWIGVYFVSELDPMTVGDKPVGKRMMIVNGLDEPFMWRPFPEAPTDRSEV